MTLVAFHPRPQIASDLGRNVARSSNPHLKSQAIPEWERHSRLMAADSNRNGPRPAWFEAHVGGLIKITQKEQNLLRLKDVIRPNIITFIITLGVRQVRQVKLTCLDIQTGQKLPEIIPGQFRQVIQDPL